MYTWVLVMLVIVDGRWQDWHSYSTQAECEEVLRTLTYHKSDQLQGRCERRSLQLLEKVPAQ